MRTSACTSSFHSGCDRGRRALSWQNLFTACRSLQFTSHFGEAVTALRNFFQKRRLALAAAGTASGAQAPAPVTPKAGVASAVPTPSPPRDNRRNA
jgi:hypothetical protein